MYSTTINSILFLVHDTTLTTGRASVFHLTDGGTELPVSIPVLPLTLLVTIVHTFALIAPTAGQKLIAVETEFQVTLAVLLA